jgi:AraC-like DNA-binding protein
LPQSTMNLPKSMPGFSRYDFFPDGTVQNKATGQIVAKDSTVASTTPAFRVTDDKGKRTRIYQKQIFELFAADQAPVPAKKPSAYERQQPERKLYKRLTEVQINDVLKRASAENAPQGIQKTLADEYGVSESTVSRLINKQTRIKSYYCGAR